MSTPTLHARGPAPTSPTLEPAARARRAPGGAAHGPTGCPTRSSRRRWSSWCSCTCCRPSAALVLSFKKLNIFTFHELFGAPWNGLRELPLDPARHRQPAALGLLGRGRRTPSVYTFWTVGGTLVGGLAVALLLNRKMRGQRVARTLMLVPWIVPSYVVAVLWSFMWQSDVGIINKVLVDYTHLLGHRPIWLLGPNTMWAIVIPSIWRGLPLAILIFLAGPAGAAAGAARGGGDRRRRPVAALPLHHAAAAAAADRRAAAVRRHLRRLPVRDPERDVRLATRGRTPT